MKKPGEFLRQTRIEQGLSPKEIYGQEISKSSYHRFENDLQSIPYHKLKIILDRLDLTFDEFEFILNGYNNTIKYTFVSRFKNLRNTTNQNAMSELITDIETILLTRRSPFLVDLKAILESLLIFQQTQSFEKARKGVVYIWDKLEKKDEWNFTDILLIANIFYIFPTGTIETIYDLLMKAIQRYQHYPWISNYNMSVPLNYCLYLRNNGRIMECLPYLEKTLDIAKKEKSTLNLIDARYRLCEIMYLKGDQKQATQIYKEILSILNFLEETHFSSDIKSDWDELPHYKQKSP